MVLITGFFVDSGGAPLADGFIKVTLDAPLVDITTSPDSLYIPIERNFSIINGQLPINGATRGFDLPQTATSNLTYSFGLYVNELSFNYYFSDGRFYDGVSHLFSDGFYYTGASQSIDSVRLDRVQSITPKLIGDTFHAIIPNVVTVEFSQLLPTRISTDKLPTTIQQIAEVLVNTPQYLALLTQVRWEGDYVNTQFYSKFDEVGYAGSSWIYINNIPTIGQVPSTLNTAYWQIRASKGDSGGTQGQDTAYSPSGWDGQTWAPTANVLRDIINTLATQAALALYAPLTNAALITPTRTTNPSNSDRSLAIPTTQWIGTNFATLDSPTFINNVAVPLYATSDRSNKAANTQWVDNYFVAKNLVNTPYFIVNKNNSQTLVTGYNTLVYTTKTADTNNAFNLASGTFVVPTGLTGLYDFTHTVYFERTAGAATYDVLTELYVNGTTSYRMFHLSGVNNTNICASSSKTLYLNAGETVQFRVYVLTNGNTLVSNNAIANNILTECSGKRLLT